MDAKAIQVIDLLKSGQTFDISTFGNTLAAYMYFDGPLAPLRKFMPTDMYSSFTDGFFGNHLKERPRIKSQLDFLSAGTLALAFKEAPDQWGFGESVNRDEARKLVETTLLQLIPHLIEAHIDALLDSSALSHLAQLLADQNFVDAFIRELKTTEVQSTLIVANNSPYGQSFLGTLIYVLEYFNQKGTPYVRGHLAAQGSSDDSFSAVVEAWLASGKVASEGGQRTFAQVFDDMLDAEEKDPNTVLKDAHGFAQELLRTIMPLEILYLPQLDIGSDVPYIASSLLDRVTKLNVSPKFSKFVLSAIPKEMMSFAAELNTEWALHIGKLAGMVRSSNGNFFETQEYGEYLDPNALSVHIPLGHKYHWVNQHYAQENADCQKNVRKVPNLWHNVKIGSRSMLPCDETWNGVKDQRRIRRKDGSFHSDDQGSAGCFRAGTLVLTKKGPRAIELLQENDRVLTRADPQEYGIRSDEEVFLKVPGNEVTLHGFNGDECFFTASHVFHTTSGLRALNPEAARAENPWIQVGRLRAGHVLIRTTNGRTYTYVPISSIETERTTCNGVYGVHLREGLRSYHANGYLVHLNYPEITMKTLVKLLLTFGPEQRMQLLKSAKELQPLFARFGAGTLAEVLESELAGDEERLAEMQEQMPVPEKVLPLYFQNRSFSLSAHGTSDGSDYSFPQVTVCDGIMYVDDESCYAAKITERGFMWSRQRELESGAIWEHGICTFGQDSHLL